MNKPERRFSKAAQQKMLRHPWPGNVRELRNAVERAVILERGVEIQPESLPDFKVEARLGKEISGPGPVFQESDKALEESVMDFERQMIVAALREQGFNLNRTAEQLKISRHALRYRMQRLEIHEEEVQTKR